MQMKAAHESDNKGLGLRTRKHIVSRLVKAARLAEDLAATLAGDRSAPPNRTDLLESEAYAALLKGAADFESHNWQSSLRNYATVRIIYSALKPTVKRDVFSDLITETVDPSMRYAAYRLKIPRTQPLPSIARDSFPTSKASLVDSLKAVDAGSLTDEDNTARQGSQGIPQTLSWRSREVQIEDAAISEAWSAVQKAKVQLRDELSSKRLAPKDMAAAYDNLLAASQDAVDATRQAIEDLRGEGVSQSDPRMQSLQITRTAVNYENISWRIGRNRVLIGEKDGLVNESIALRRKRKALFSVDQGAAQEDTGDSIPLGRRLTQTKEKVVLYDGTLQSIESVRELPGVAADEGLTTQLDATYQYFDALKYVSLKAHPHFSHRLTYLQMPCSCKLALLAEPTSQCACTHPVRSGSGRSCCLRALNGVSRSCRKSSEHRCQQEPGDILTRTSARLGSTLSSPSGAWQTAAAREGKPEDSCQEAAR
jgi:signal recognition particle subunit SRP68